MSQEQRQVKRQRTEDTEDGLRHKSKKYWFDDGNIVLKTRDTLYRVHGSVLARHSRIFKDLFSIPQLSMRAESRRVDGCSVIPLTDSDEDMENLLSIFYDSKIDKFRGQLSVLMVGSMLRLGKKYAITHFEEEALFRLHHDYPQNLVTWDALFIKFVQPLIECKDAEDVACVIDIAHEFQLSTILPAAYSRYLTIQSTKKIFFDYFLPPKAKERCLLGHAKMLKYLKDKNIDALCPPFFIPAKSCTGPCEGKKWDVIKGLQIWETKLIGILDRHKGEPLIVTDLCSWCKGETRKFTEKTRQNFWERLPTFYGLPAWEDLKDGSSDGFNDFTD